MREALAKTMIVLTVLYLLVWYTVHRTEALHELHGPELDSLGK